MPTLCGRTCRSLFTGNVASKQRKIERFVTDPEVPVFLLNKACGAVGINLTMATHVLILEPSFEPLSELQAISRANRLGQEGPIEVRRYVTQGAPLPPASAHSLLCSDSLTNRVLLDPRMPALRASFVPHAPGHRRFVQP